MALTRGDLFRIAFAILAALFGVRWGLESWSAPRCWAGGCVVTRVVQRTTVGMPTVVEVREVSWA